MAAHSLARSLASMYWTSAQTFPNRGTPRSDALAAGLLRRAEALLATARGCLPHLRRWLPQLQMQAHEHYQRHFERSLAEVQQGGVDCGGRLRSRAAAGVYMSWPFLAG